jgi:hypothetical protein
MKIFQRFFSKTSKLNEPDNTKHLKLLDIYWKADGKGKTYEK